MRSDQSAFEFARRVRQVNSPVGLFRERVTSSATILHKGLKGRVNAVTEARERQLPRSLKLSEINRFQLNAELPFQLPSVYVSADVY